MPFVLYRSSAGSGKTYTLVKEYLKLVLENPQKFKHTLAITFTNKAAGEMKERLLQALKTLAANDPEKNLADVLRAESPHIHHIDQTSSFLLTTLLHNYSDFAIMTIDSFIHKIIKGFALEINLPLNFNIDLNFEKIQTYVIEQLLDSVGRDRYITDIILKFVFDRMIEGKSWNIESDMRHFERELFSEKNADWVEAIHNAFNPEAFDDYITQLKQIRDGFLKQINTLGQDAMSLINAAGLSVDDFAYKKSGAAGFLQKCAELKPGELKRFDLSRRFQDNAWMTKSTPQAIKTRIESLPEQGLTAIQEELIRVYLNDYAETLTAVFVLDNIYLTAIIKRMIELIEIYKRKNNVVPISEFNIKVYHIVRHSPIPFIYAMIGEKFNHYLIDEFQDTSRLQWENLFPLIDNSIGSNFFNMAVGDGKQSIYRWRGGDMEIMEKNVKERMIPDELQIRVLHKNYRSKEKLLEFNNRFFTELGKANAAINPLLSQIYLDVEQEPVRKPGGFVSLQFIGEPQESETNNDNNDNNDETDEDTNGTNGCSLESPQTDVFLRVKAIIAECLDHGFTTGDIAILVRENKNGQKVAEYLLEQGIHVVSPDSLILDKIPLIRFLIDILTYLTNPSDKITEASIIFFLAFNKKDHTPHPPDVGDAFLKGTQWDLLPEFSEFFHRRKYLIRMPVYEVIEEVIRVFRLAESLSFETAGYLQAFLDIVSNYSMENSVDFTSFLDWWDAGKDEFTVMVPETKPAVKIMSIHKAKGLQFPVVIIPFADWKHKMDKQLWLVARPPLRTDPPLNIPMPVNTTARLEDSYFREEYEKEKIKVEIDNANLLYVAFTRAEERLYILSRQRKTNENVERLNTLAVPWMSADPTVEGRYTYGDPLPVTRSDHAKNGEIAFVETNRFLSNSWHSRITIRRNAADFWRFDESYRTGRRKYGILIHRVLSTIRTIRDADEAMTTIRLSGDMDTHEKDELATKIRDIFEIEAVNRWFADDPAQTVFTECSILTDAGILRPDRVVVSGSHATLIDFKTGEPRNTHLAQMARYTDAMRAMGYETIRAFLFYIDTKQIVEIPDNRKPQS
ncbi:MAG: UvrD-helicase domain-containing protein [Candidatus Omnitrophota bacterium]